MADRIRALYGDDRLAPPHVMHVVAAWQAPDGSLYNMRIGPQTPHSPTDAFVLALARARSQAIVTTGRILRDEPGLSFVPATEDVAALGRWRRVCLGRDAPPLLVVLTRGTALDLDHPALGGMRVLVMTDRAGAAALSERMHAASSARLRGVEVMARDEPGLLDAIEILRDARGLAPVLVEAGPSTASVLYEVPGHVDELMLSICHAPVLPEDVRGAPLPTARDRMRIGLIEVSRVETDEPSGRWSFTRHLRDGSPDAG